MYVGPPDTSHQDPSQHGYEADEEANARCKNKDTLLAPTSHVVNFLMFGYVEFQIDLFNMLPV